MEKVEKILTNIIKIITNFILVVLTVFVLVLIYNIIQISVLNKEYMNIFGYSLFQVKTGSMSGTMEIGDIIIVKLTKEVNENDIITFIQDDTIVTHRIIQKSDNHIITKGDANNSADNPILIENVIGKVAFTFKNIKIWEKVFCTPEVYILIIITLVLFGISMSIKDKKETIR